METHGGAPRGRRIVVLIHGYQNRRSKAEARYVDLMAKLRDDYGVPRHQQLQVWWLFWPGDSVFPVWTIASYPAQISTAVAAGKMLAGYFRTLGRSEGYPLNVELIAHSLGSRLALEFALDLSEEPAQGVHVASLTLMAGAVPVSFCDSGGQFGDVTRALDERMLVLHSPCDGVLSKLFPAGQRLEMLSRRRAEPADARVTPSAAEAVGRWGNPWRTRLWTRAKHYDTGLGHGKYFKKPQSVSRIASSVFGKTATNEPPHRSALCGRALRRHPPPQSWLLVARRLHV